MKKNNLYNWEEDEKLTDEEFYKKYNFDEEEIALEQSVARGEWISLPKGELEIEKRRLAEYAKYTLEKRKGKNMNIRMQQSDIEKLKQKSIKLGIPYQTIAASILHQYANDMIEVKL